MEKLINVSRVIIINSLIIFIFIFLFELFFGFWFDKNNLGIYVREHRNINIHYKVKINNVEKKVNYKRNFFGFREEKNIDPSKIKIIFLGGSTGNERFKNYDETIVGQINKNLSDKKIINASTDGKTLRGHYYDFKYWFERFENFGPEAVIIYAGINDHRILHPKKHDLAFSKNKLIQLRDLVSNNSITIYIFKRLTWKIKSLTNFYDSRYNFNWGEKYKNFKYIDYDTAKKIHNIEELKVNYEEKVKQINERLNILTDEINKYGSKIIFITQIYYDGLVNPELFLVNNLIKEFSEKKNINIIKLDEIIKMSKFDFYDGAHTTVKGSSKIAKVLSTEIIKILEEKNLY